ncbi:hypothetical protein P389DRAFT_211226 [Cystobasidium minutum MCA 4210]|uniref:uncharacterized protein n=1 Tax=Cystobasidium minutum MCA 4210 TaxID=1397322 RepID=UPI0034CD4915|eukprot:jgi/Rhomi1/211226/estExt_Genemark1.C_4_t20377
MRDPNAKLQRASATARGAWEAVNAPSEASRGLFSSLRDQRKQSRRIEIALKAIGNWQKAAEEALGAAKRRRAAAETISRTCAEALLKADERLIQFEKRAGWDAKREDLDSDQDVSESDLNDGHILRGHTLESKRERPILKRLEAFKCRTGIILAEAAYARAAVKAKKARKDLYEAQKAVSLAKTERENAFCLNELGQRPSGAGLKPTTQATLTEVSQAIATTTLKAILPEVSGAIATTTVEAILTEVGQTIGTTPVNAILMEVGQGTPTSARLD